MDGRRAFQTGHLHLRRCTSPEHNRGQGLRDPKKARQYLQAFSF